MNFWWSGIFAITDKFRGGVIKRKCDAGMKAAMTLEAAILVPLYIFFFWTFFSVFEMFHFYGNVEYELSAISKDIALYSQAGNLLGFGQKDPGAVEEGEDANAEAVTGVAATVLADLYAGQRLNERLTQEYLSAVGVSGEISLWRSRVLIDSDFVDLIAVYDMEPNCNVFAVPAQRLVTRARTRAWNGYDNHKESSDESQEQTVYVTETGTVYHVSRSCTHLSLSITSVLFAEIENLQNSNGGYYSACEICGGFWGANDTVYITNDGDRYHFSLTCSALKRTIYEIPISEVGEKRLCARCAAGRNTD